MRLPAIKLFPTLTSIWLKFLTYLPLFYSKCTKYFLSISILATSLLSPENNVAYADSTPVSSACWSSSTFLTSEYGYSCKTLILFQRTVIQRQVSWWLPDKVSHCPQIHIGIQNLPKIKSYLINITSICTFVLNRL